MTKAYPSAPTWSPLARSSASESVMKRGIDVLVVTLALVCAAGNFASAQTPTYKVVVNQSCPVSSLRRSTLADYVLKRASRWPDGSAVAVVDLSATSPVRAAFSQAVLNRSVDAVLHYWQQQIFTGRGTPPPVKSEMDSLALVAARPGAIAYVGPDTPLPPGTRPIPIAY